MGWSYHEDCCLSHAMPFMASGSEVKCFLSAAFHLRLNGGCLTAGLFEIADQVPNRFIHRIRC